MEILSDVFKSRISNTTNIAELEEELKVIMRIYYENEKYREEMRLKSNFINNRIEQLKG
ncbi:MULTISPECIES: hypothetical protein [Priestia]|uniref:hypothetical protein n=1 Tax=Priestia TaxID=2800373 RepID=UPI00138F54A5|nr:MULTISPECIES: hypothetical protein [Priestia]MBE5100231.1 hypothetical protein [Priestia aryabhattai]MBY0091575.1 hypothetical protein [Priestia aryabhattai]MBY0104199.1 hypothetical protein [Priestia aryabhattai]MBY0213487.1 hypothetical protein [Priestia aryabhattai]MCM3306954.1 hypothetical protein [Priestia megaterium]